jgi:hypothetical protein
MLLSVSAAHAAGSGMPWEAPLQRVLESVSGTTANISITYGFVGYGVQIGIDVYAIKSLSSMTPTGSGSNSSTSASALTTGAVATSAGGVVIAGSAQRSTNSNSNIISGTSGTFVQNHPNFVLSGFSSQTVASATGLAASASTTLTATWNGTEVSALAAAAWR